MEGVRQAKWRMENTLKSAVPKDKDICIECTKKIQGFTVWGWEYSLVVMCWPNLHEALALVPSTAITITTMIIVTMMTVLSKGWTAECT